MDMTPRPAYVALAAVGRLLAEAKCLGRWAVPDSDDAYVIAFRARPDGLERDVLVAWAEKKVDWPQRAKTKVPFSLPWSQGYEYRIESEAPYNLRMFAYNFSSEPVKGTIRVTNKPSGWTQDREIWNLSVDSMQCELFETTLTVPAGQDGTIQLTGDFGPAGKSVLAFRMHGRKN